MAPRRRSLRPRPRSGRPISSSTPARHDPRAARCRQGLVSGLGHQADDGLSHLPGAEVRAPEAHLAGVRDEDALAQPPTKMGYAVGTAMTFDNALKMMIVHSANDIAVAISEAVGGSKAPFVERMNATRAVSA